MTHVISAFPCLGKTTLYQLNKERIFDREFNESRSVLGMNESEKYKFSHLCSEILNLQISTGHHDYIFVTDEKSIVSKLETGKSENSITYIFPNVFDKDVMEDYKKRVIVRSGVDWYNRVIVPRLATLPETIAGYQKQGVDIRLTDLSHPYIEDVFKFNSNIRLPI